MESRRSGVAAFVLCLLSAGALGVAYAADGEAAPPSKPDYSACKRADFRVVVDVGHTLEVPGAMSARGVPEYTFNLRLAKAVEQSLTEAGFSRATLLITTGKKRAGLASRVAKANHRPADLFLSIHHDSVPDRFKAKWEYEGKEYAYCDRFPGHSIFISNDNVNRAGSLEFAKLLGTQLKARGLRYTPHYTEPFMGNRRRELVDAETGVYRYDQLIVLRRTHMPAALLEAGSIVNREEELLLASPERQALISAAVTEAVEAFCASRATRVADGAQRPLTIQADGARPTAAPQQAKSVKRR